MSFLQVEENYEIRTAKGGFWQKPPFAMFWAVLQRQPHIINLLPDNLQLELYHLRQNPP